MFRLVVSSVMQGAEGITQGEKREDLLMLRSFYQSQNKSTNFCVRLEHVNVDVCTSVGPFHFTTSTQETKRSKGDKIVETVQSAFVTGELKISSDKDKDLQSWP